MVKAAEICIVVKSSIEALKLYESIFEIKKFDVVDKGIGLSEAIFGIYGTIFHLLDENHAHMLFAPQGGDIQSIWMNIAVPNIDETFKKAMDAGCRQISPVTKIGETKVKNAVFADNLGYIWMLHQFEQNV